MSCPHCQIGIMDLRTEGGATVWVCSNCGHKILTGEMEPLPSAPSEDGE